MSNVAFEVKCSDMAAGTRPWPTTLPLTRRTTSIGPPILSTSLDSTSTLALPTGSGLADRILVRCTSNRLNS